MAFDYGSYVRAKAILLNELKELEQERIHSMTGRHFEFAARCKSVDGNPATASEQLAMLRWSSEVRTTPEEMTAWHRAQSGQDISQAD